MTIKIVFPEGEPVKLGRGTKVFTDSGEEIHGITCIEIQPIEMDKPITAHITCYVSEIENLHGIEGIIFAEDIEADQA